MRLVLNGRNLTGEGLAADSLEVVAETVRLPFIELMDRIGAAQGANLDWWVTPLASRNTYACPLYLRLCQLVLARRLIQAGEIGEVVTDSPALAAAVAVIARRGVCVSMARSVWRARLSRVFGVFYRYAGALYHVVCQFLFSRLVLSRRTTLPSDRIILIDTFIYVDSCADGQLHDRHYPGMTDHLDVTERNQVFFVPSYYRVRNYARFFRGLREVRRNLILKEDVLHLSDYLFALGHPFRLRWPKGQLDFLGMDVGPLVREALADCFAGSGAIEGLLRYRFAQRLKEKDIRPLRIIEWFENQEVDHGANAGWRTFFPDTLVVGYQGFLASRHYLSVFPLTKEVTLRLVPNRVAVIGQGLVVPVREFCPELKVDVAPAFRFSAVWRERINEPNPSWFTVLVTLSLISEESRTILNLAAHAACQAQGGKPWRFWVKSHPASRRSETARIAAALPQGFEMMSDDFEKLLDRSDALVSAASSTGAHAIARGVPIAVVGQRGGLVQNPIPVFTDTSLWAVCYSATDLRQTLSRYADADLSEIAHWRDLGRQFRERTFEPVTRKSVRRFLGFEDVDSSVNCAPALPEMLH